MSVLMYVVEIVCVWGGGCDCVSVLMYVVEIVCMCVSKPA